MTNFYLTPTADEDERIKPYLSKLDRTFIVASIRGDLDTMTKCKEQGVNINFKGGCVTEGEFSEWTAAHFASYKGKDAAVKLLAEWGANLEAKDKDGFTPFMVANGPVVHCLISLGVDIFAKDKSGKTRLDYRREDWLRQYYKVKELEKELEEQRKLLEEQRMLTLFVAALTAIAVKMLMTENTNV